MTSEAWKTMNYADKPGAWGDYIRRKAKESAVQSPRGVRYICPCCGYPTLEEKRPLWEICDLCDWEDDGQDDPKADEVWGGPNKHLSLTEARENFKRYLIKFSPEQTPTSLTGNSNTEKEHRAKRAMMEAFEKMESEKDRAKLEVLWQQVYDNKVILYNELTRMIAEHEQRVL